MTREQAKTEIMQIYGLLSEEKKKALDVAFKAMEQADNIPVMYYPQVDGITPTVVAQADGKYISRKALLDDLYKRDYTKFTHRDFVALVQYQDIVAIPPDHDGCKDCKYETYPEYYYPCCECKQDYTDEWQKKPHWNHGVCDNCGYDWGKDAPIASVPNFCPNCGSPMEIER